ncbi:hypothetical protein BCR33DRAFT_788396 [Rhizoclosmatium globosum]|uniref:Bromo domain-containing protein n=1 Tax=Rhizoclosmatium globosum TaxID=329046 RepID=A0A1Y2BX90_9FUNG|nr:hypothetical protein BCR33DRAFT_788396 [Rhizoclosmatium globosum]|eukprot:ORY39389.1 hypothetical protein BCR33DRAFT_788396 [Rhizoclosmatium globosum]
MEQLLPLARHLHRTRIDQQYLDSAQRTAFVAALESSETWSLFSGSAESFSVRTMLFDQFLGFGVGGFGGGVVVVSGAADADVARAANGNTDNSNSNSSTNETSDEQQIAANVPIDDSFYSLEFDRVFISQYNPDEAPKVRDIQQNHEAAAASSTADSSKKAGAQRQTTSNVPMPEKNDDPDNLKFLFDVISKNTRPEKEKELKNLVQRLKRSRSKWAHDYRIGQEVLYEALEKTLIELKNYTEHSEPFLVRVSKKDVPDYYDVIKNPMDLGTMTKKLTNLEYMSKDDFASDLSLIWSNCLTFNVQPDSIYRKKAFMMKRKSLDLLKRVPDIKIIVKPQEPESESDDDEKDEDKGGEVVSKRAAAKASNLAGSSAARKTPAPVEEPPIIINFDDDEPMGEAATPAVAVGAGEPTSRTATPAPQVDGGEIKRESTPDVKTDVKKDPGSNSVPMATGPDAPTAPTPEDGPEFDEDYVAGASIQVKKYLDVTEELRKNNYMSREHSLNTPSFGDRFAVSRNPAGFQTFLESFNEFCERNIKRKSGKLDDEADKDGKVTKLIAKNVEFLRKIKDIHCRIIARMTDDPNLIPPPRVPPPSKTDAERSARMPDFVVTPDAADAIMTQLTSRLLMHTGFDAIQGSALAILNDIGIQYMQNLGKTLRLYVDKEDQTLSHEDILKRTLQVNGVENANKLDLYVRNDIQRYSVKLFDLKKKLSLIGNFLEDLGVDFLNLKDLGIDVTSIPLEVWNRKADSASKIKKREFSKEGSAIPGNSFDQVDPETQWKPVNPSSVIGILKTFYNARAETNDMRDDEEQEIKSKAFQKTKAMVKQANLGRKKHTAAEIAKLAKQTDLAKSKEEAKRKREAEKAEKAKLKEEKKLVKKSKGNPPLPQPQFPAVPGGSM